MASSTAFCAMLLLCLLLAAIAAPVQAARGHHRTHLKAPPPQPRCPKGQLLCSGSCTNSTIDELNCGTCGHDCTALFMPYGACCGGDCVDFGYDNQNCGGCNHACPGNTTCCSQACASTLTDIFNCGSCGNVCDTAYCCDGKCTDEKSEKEECGCEPFCP